MARTLGLVQAVAAGEDEIGLAHERAFTQDQFGRRMVDEHTAANGRLVALAQDKGIVVPGSLDPAQRVARVRLDRLSGAAFDRTYLRGQVDSIALPLEVTVAGKRPPTRKLTATGRVPGRQAR